MDGRALGDGERRVSTLRHRTGRFALVVGALVLGWQAFLALSAPRRVDGALATQLEQAEYANITVTLGFPPEDFHIRVFQGSSAACGARPCC